MDFNQFEVFFTCQLIFGRIFLTKFGMQIPLSQKFKKNLISQYPKFPTSAWLGGEVTHLRHQYQAYFVFFLT